MVDRRYQAEYAYSVLRNLPNLIVNYLPVCGTPRSIIWIKRSTFA